MFNQKSYAKQWYLNNMEKVKTKAKQWTLNNPDKAKASAEKWNHNNSEKVKASKEKWQEDNPEYAKRYRRNNKEKINARSKQWAKDNPEKMAEDKRQWYLNNPDKVKEISDEQHCKRRGLGFIPLNKPFKDCEGHHINKNNVVHIPKKLHKSVAHNLETNKNMQVINRLADNYLKDSDIKNKEYFEVIE